MQDAYITLEEAAAFEGIKYNTLVQRMKRTPDQYDTKTQAREGGGKDQVLISVADPQESRWDTFFRNGYSERHAPQIRPALWTVRRVPRQKDAFCGSALPKDCSDP